MSTTQIEEKNEEEAKNEPLVLDSGATSHYYPTSFEARSELYNSSSQGNRIIIANSSEVHIREFKKEFKRLVLVGALVQQQV